MSDVTHLATLSNVSVRETHEWGHLTWLVNSKLTPQATMTVGTCLIEPGRSNPLHYHPNCAEVMVVTGGRCMKRVGDETIELGPGDSILIPPGVPHQATVIGDQPMTCVISYDSPDREFVPVESKDVLLIEG